MGQARELVVRGGNAATRAKSASTIRWTSLLDYQAAAVGFAVAFLLVVLLTPVVSLAASRAGVLDRTDGDRRMHRRPLPLSRGARDLRRHRHPVRRASARSTASTA